jgi:predicted RNA binding protein YcfA (HicA-like mRNA interferase family)
MTVTDIGKLTWKFVHRPNTITLMDCERMLEYHGYERAKVKSGHRIFRKKAGYPFNLPTLSGRKVKACYVEKLIDFLRLEEHEA